MQPKGGEGSNLSMLRFINAKVQPVFMCVRDLKAASNLELNMHLKWL